MATTEAPARVLLGDDPGLVAVTSPQLERRDDAFDTQVRQAYGDRDDVVTDAFDAVYLYPLADYGLIAIASTDSRTFDGSERKLVTVIGRSVTVAFPGWPRPERPRPSRGHRSILASQSRESDCGVR